MKRTALRRKYHRIKYGRIQVLIGPYSPSKRQNRENPGQRKPVFPHILCCASKLRTNETRLMYRRQINWYKVFKNGSSKICGRLPLENFTWSTLEYFVPIIARFLLGNKRNDFIEIWI